MNLATSLNHADIAILISEKLGDHKSALEALGKVVAEHPQSQYTAAAQFKIAEIKREKLKDYAGAIADYRKFIDNAADSTRAVEALWAVGEINLNNLIKLDRALHSSELIATPSRIMPVNGCSAKQASVSSLLLYELQHLRRGPYADFILSNLPQESLLRS